MAPDKAPRDPRLLPDDIALLRRGDPDETPLFMVHAVGGSSRLYAEFARSLDALAVGGPVFGIGASGMHEGTRPRSSVPRMVDAYLAKIDLVAGPDTPVMLGGWCFGAFLAAAMTARREAAERPVEALFLVDPLPRVEGAGLNLAGYRDLLSDMIRQMWRIEVDADSAGYRAMSELERVDHLIAEGRRQGRLTDDGDDGAFIVRLAEVERAHLAAARSFELTDVLRTPAHVITATGHSPAARRAIEDYWRRRLAGPATFHDVAVVHARMFTAPDVGLVAERFAAVIGPTVPATA